jgi:putative oxidoreductase
MARLSRRVFGTDAGWAALVLRVPVGIIFMGHGSQKLFGWFGGGGPEGTAEAFASMGLEPGLPMALLGGSAEFFGGMLLVLGFLVRPAGLVLAVTMLVAIFAAHIENGLFLANNGYEYALTLFTISVSLLFSGAGRISVDEVLGGPAYSSAAAQTRGTA